VILPDFSPLDYAAIAWFVACWLGYTLAADKSRLSKKSMSSAMNGYRKRWMLEMLRRENRIVDIQIVGNLLNGAAFFASTTILAVGGLFALLGATEAAVGVLSDLPIAVSTSRLVFEIKVLFLITIFVHGFFKFAWAFRLFNFCSVLIGSAPVEWRDNPDSRGIAERAAAINDLAAGHFNRGLRAYFFSLATLGWFVHPLLFMAATAWVVRVLYRREFRSKSLKAIRGLEAAGNSP
jgi:uncharacterized membrane protein